MSYPTPDTAPGTYHQWKKVFEAFQTKAKLTEQDLRLVALGTLSGTAETYRQFHTLLLATVNHLLTKYSQQFLRELRLRLQMGDVLDTIGLFRRYAKESQGVFFFEKLTVLTPEDKENLKEGVQQEIASLWTSCLTSLEQQRGNHSDVDDVLFMIKRLKPFE